MKFDEREMERTTAIIKSMTAEERRHPRIIDGSRKKRIARGRGTRADGEPTVEPVFRAAEDVHKYGQ